MSKQAWRIKLEQWLVANGDEGMSGIVDHLEFFIRVSSFMRTKGFKDGIEKLMRESGVLDKRYLTMPNEANPAPILRRLYEDQTITISARDGSRCISKEEKLFAKNGIDGNFKNWKLNNRSRPTDKINVEVHEMVKDAKYTDAQNRGIFDSFGSDLDRLCLTQDQILAFLKENFVKLRQEGCATFFLFKEGEDFFVARAHMLSDDLNVYVHRFERDVVCPVGCAHRVVVPQLIV